ncbi:unnamed protein product, partial [Staurois parvus]
MFAEAVCMPMCLIFTPVAMEVIVTPESNDLERRPNTFGNIVYITIAKSVSVAHV